MMVFKKSLSFVFDDIPIEKIQEIYNLNSLIGADYVETENIATLIRQIYIYSGLYSSPNLDKLSKKLIAREVLILTYSVLEGTQNSMAKRMQILCKKCKQKCNLYNTDLLRVKNEQISSNSFNYLIKDKIITFTSEQSKFYSILKTLRNNVHIVAVGQQIKEYPLYNDKLLNIAINFMEQNMKMYKKNIDSRFNLKECLRKQ
jgi:hypothetical protein